MKAKTDEKKRNMGVCDVRSGAIKRADLLKAQADFLARLDSLKLSPATVEKRMGDLKKFCRYLQALDLKLGQVTPQTVDGFRLELLHQGYMESTVLSSLQALRSFFAFLMEENRIFDNPVANLVVPSPPRTMGRVFTVEEVKRILAVPDLSTREGLRDRAILETLYSVGLRRKELSGLTLFDIDLSRKHVRVTGKGNKERLLPLGTHAVTFLRLYIRDARPKFLPRFQPPPDALWLTHHQRALSASQIGDIMAKAGKAAKVPGVSAHAFRRTCATHLLRGGAHPQSVAQMLGHTNLQSLCYYLETTMADLMAAHRKSRPGK